MTRSTLVKVGVAALFGFLGGAAVDIRKYRQRDDKAQPFNWRTAVESWALSAAAAGLGALGLTGLGGELPPPVLE